MSTATRFGPLSLLGASVLPVLGAPAIHSTRHGLICVGALLLVAGFVVRDWRETMRRFAVLFVAVLSVAVSTWLYGGRDADVAIGAATRILYLVLPAVVLTPFIDSTRLGDHLAQRLRLPARPVVAATAALERLESLGSQWQQIGRARRARGVGMDGGPLNRVRVSASMGLALLVSTMRMSGAMSLAMDARGFESAHRRTWAESAPWYRRDTAILAGGVAVAVLPWLLLVPAVGGPLGVG